MQITPEQWQTVRSALERATHAFADLVEAVPAQTPATLDWSAAETAAHVAAVAALDRALLRPEQDLHPFPELQEHLLAGHVDAVADFNERVLRVFPERDPGELARRLRADVADLLATSAEDDPAAPVRWLGDSRLPVAGLFAHLLNELLLHGRDIAVGAGRRWSVPPAETALFFELFLRGVTLLGSGRLLEHGTSPAPRRIAVRFRSRHTTPVTYVADHGTVSLQPPGPGDDVRIWFDPTYLDLMLFGRISKPRAALSGKVLVGGPRPWLLPAFMRTMHLPGRADPATLAYRDS